MAKTFEQRISKLSKKTQDNILAASKNFERFCIFNYEGRKSQDIFEELNTLKGIEQAEGIRSVLQEWIDWQYENGCLTSSIQQYVSKIKRVFLFNGVKIHTEDFDEPLEFKPKIKEELHALTLEEIQNILKFVNPKKYSFYFALISTGARPGEILQVRKKDIDTTKKRIKIRIEAENVKTRSGRSVFLTKEAGHYLMARLRRLDDEDLVWGTNENFAHAERNESTQFSKACDKAGYTARYKSNNFRQITLYSFRSFYFGKAADVHREGYAHRMTGHGGYLPQYDRMSDEQKMEWFLKLEPELTIDSKERDKIKIQNLESEKTELAKQQDKVNVLMDNIQSFINNSSHDEETKQMLKKLFFNKN